MQNVGPNQQMLPPHSQQFDNRPPYQEAIPQYDNRVPYESNNQGYNDQPPIAQFSNAANHGQLQQNPTLPNVPIAPGHKILINPHFRGAVQPPTDGE